MESEYLIFKDHGPSPSGKTNNWGVYSKRQGNILGSIHWHGPWRQYIFNPTQYTIWNKGCLADIQTFLTEQMDARKKTKEE